MTRPRLTRNNQSYPDHSETKSLTQDLGYALTRLVSLKTTAYYNVYEDTLRHTCYLTTLYDVVKIVIRVRLYAVTDTLRITPRRAYALDTRCTVGTRVEEEASLQIGLGGAYRDSRRIANSRNSITNISECVHVYVLARISITASSHLRLPSFFLKVANSPRVVGEEECIVRERVAQIARLYGNSSRRVFVASFSSARRVLYRRVFRESGLSDAPMGRDARYSGAPYKDHDGWIARAPRVRTVIYVRRVWDRESRMIA